jgi:hypothetical protein
LRENFPVTGRVNHLNLGARGVAEVAYAQACRQVETTDDRAEKTHGPQNLRAQDFRSKEVGKAVACRVLRVKSQLSFFYFKLRDITI